MRRGLISRSLIELPDAALEARLTRLRRAMTAAGLDALVIYTNNTRPAGVSWLTGFVPYWSEALLVLPPVGPPVLVVALTFRVKPWIERTSRVGEVVHTPRIGNEAGKLIAGAKPNAAVGVIEYDNLPIGIAEDLGEAGPRLVFDDAGSLFATVRGRADPTEILLATRAAQIAASALAALPIDSAGAGDVVAAMEGAARCAGAEEIYIAVAPDLARDLRLIRIEGDVALGRGYAVRASVAYKGNWVRRTRTVLRERDGGAPGQSATSSAAARFAAAVAELPDPRSLAQFASYLVEGCRLTQPLEPLMGSPLAATLPLSAGAVVSVQAIIVEDGQPILIGAPVLLGAPGEAASVIGPLDA
jgi:hypothetical protein